MIKVFFDSMFMPYVDNQECVELPGPTTLKELLLTLFSRYPQLCATLMENNDTEYVSFLTLNDDELLENTDTNRLLVDGDILHIGVLPTGSYELSTIILDYAIAAIAEMTGAEIVISEVVFDILTGVIFGAILSTVNMALSAVMGAIFGDVAPPDANMGIANSTTYTFDGIKNSSYSGAPVHIVYGLHRAGGNLLNVYTRNDYVNAAGNSTAVTDKAGGSSYVSYLYAQIGLCEGEVEEVSDIYINKMPRNLYNGVGTPEVRTGMATQEIMLDYSRVETTTNVGRKVLCLYRTSDNSRLDFSVSATDPLFGTALSSATPYYAVLEEVGTTYRVTPGAFKIPRVWPSSAGG